MYRRKRKIQGFYKPSRSRLGGGFKLIIIAVALLALVSAIITGTVLGKNAEKSSLQSYGRHNLTDFGGVKLPAADYAALKTVRAEYVSSVGADKSAFKKDVGASDNGNAICFKTSDREGNIFFRPELMSKTPISFNVMGAMTAEEAVSAVNDSGKVSIAHFHSKALLESDPQLRIMKTAEEIAMLSELCSAGVFEIAVFDLPDESDKVTNVTPYLALLESVSKRTNICVVLSKANMESSGVTRIINATEGYSDAYAIDMSGVGNSDLGQMIEKCAYFITNYNMRVIVADSEGETKEETIAILSSYGIDSYEFVG